MIILRIISYNIHRGMDKNKKTTLFQIVKYLKKQRGDVICLQEVLRHQYEFMKFYLRMNGIFAENVKSQKYGICIFSKYKIIDKKHVFLTSKKEQRGLAYIKLKIDENNYLNIINTHLGLNKIERFKQINEILDFVKNINGKDKNIICGDFNEKNLSINNLNDASVALKKDNYPTFSKSRIDYCF
ncbi:endonuclease/exonuclease/phosphatase family protein, partial [Intestinibacter sp.]|uniref:endonuclease/exonuclease/phosphatase family protein n=1 Tax=Intestinibacter sp. TaxID=1965304 RepID=UPI003F153A7D